MDRPALPGARPALLPGALVSGAELENLPSFGMSSYMNLESGAETQAMLTNIREGKYPTQKVDNGDQLKLRGSTSSPPRPGPSRMAPPATTSSSGKQIQVIIQDDKEYEQEDQNEYGFKFAAATAPITSTVDASQIMMETEANTVQSLGVAARPELRVRMMTNYMRFRYMSEKCPRRKKGAKMRFYEVDDSDKNCLAEVTVDNYTGVGKVVAYCVDITGKLHPYNLFGEGCHQGVYVWKLMFRPGKTLRLKKVSVTTPKAKEYAKNLENQLSYLTQVGIHDVKFCKPEEIQDKQIVYVMFKIILDDYNGEILSQISTPLQNKKKGSEFRIEDVEPVSCPANMQACYNPDKYRVMLHVTEGTAFPADIGVKIRERDSAMQVVWEAEPASLKTIKQCVVKFVPPSYKNVNTKEDVQVEICLYDKATKIETEPFKFVYRGSDNVQPEMNLENKAKKRKLTDDIDMSQLSFVPGNTVGYERKTLTALRSRPTSASSRSSDSSSSDNSLTYIEETQSQQASGSYTTDPSTQTQTDPTQTMTAGSEDRAVSLRQRNSANGHLPFTSYTGNVGHGQNEGQSNFGPSSSQTVHNSSRPQSAGFMGDITGADQSASLNQSSLVTSTISVFGTSSTYQNSSPTMPVKSVNSTTNNTSYQQQQQPGPAPRQDSQFMVLSDEDKMNFAQHGVQFPKLGPNQMLAVIGGKIYVVNDDTVEQTQNVAPPPATYNPPSVVQNIGTQQVIIQQVAPQQPASEAEQRPVNNPPNMAQGPSQTQGMGNISHTMGNPQYGTMDSASVSAVTSQSAAIQQQNLQQQQLQQQQQQEQQQILAIQQLAQAAAAAGLDINQPEVYQQLIQQAFGLQTQILQQGATQTAGASGDIFGSGSDLNDDDVEIDGDSDSHDAENSETVNGQMSQTGGIGIQRNKKLKASSNKERDRFLQNEIIYIIPGVEEDDSSSKIPVFVNEVTIGDEGSDSDSSSMVQTRKPADYTLKNGSFGNDVGSEDEDGLR